jgi:ABC-type dipeptide/oligopeptide/nickel transport system permease component
MARRLLWTPVLLLIVSLVVFVLGTYGPGDPVEVRLGQNYTPQAAERLREQMGLNDPVAVQWSRYVANALQGDFGESYVFQGRKVTALLGPKLWTSAQLNIAAFTITIMFGVPLGFYAAKKQGTWRDPAIVISTLALFALPVFIIAPFLIWLFALRLDWLPVSGWGGFFDTRIILPAVTIGVPGIAVFVRLMRASTLDVIGQEYVRTARAKGLPETVVNYQHIARNALIPVITVMGLTFAGLLGGALITELIYGIPGIGRLVLDSIFARDYPVITAVTLIGAAMLVLANLLIDVLYTVADPRIRLQ